MSALDAAATVLAVADIDIELPLNDLAGDFRLKLDRGCGRLKLLAFALGAGLGQRHVVGFVDLLWGSPPLMLTVIFARLAPRLLPLLFEFFAERRCLAFAFAFEFLDAILQHLYFACELLLQLLNVPEQFLATRAIRIDL